MKSYKYILVILLFFTALFATETPYCLNFNGDDDYVHIDDTPLRFSWRYTLECWFNVQEFTDSAALIDFSSISLSEGHYLGYGIYTMDSNRLVIRLGSLTRHFELILDDIKSDVWQHLAVTYDKYKNDENVVVFLNGHVIKKADCNISLQYPETFRPFGVYLGAFYDYPLIRSFKGKLDDVRFWSVVRTNEEIRNSMDRVLSPDEVGLVGYYNFDQEVDSLLFDLSENENHGSLENMSDSSWQLSYAQLAVQQSGDISFDRFTLSWLASPYFDSYCVDVSETEDFSTSCAGFPVYNVRTDYYIVENIEPGSYFFRVKGHYDGETIDKEPWTDIQPIATVTDVATAIELSEFKVLAEKDHIIIHWETRSQTENSRFILERKTDGSDWKSIYEIQGAGTNSTNMSYDFQDKEIIPGVTYSYRLSDISYSGVATYSEFIKAELKGNASLPLGEFKLNSVYPNPFNPSTTISFSVLKETNLSVKIYSSKGVLIDEIYDGYSQPGSYSFDWRPKNISSGVYFLKINSAENYISHKLLYLK
jgi:concanavalin A-like lectin/glucanase superfamily protein/type IX secretion system substrate protein